MMDNTVLSHALEIMTQRFGKDALISVATMDNAVPSVRAVNSYYENGSFFIITYALSNKIQQINKNPTVGICGEWFTAHGIGENMGHICGESNRELGTKLKEVFSSWYTNGHIDESDPNTCILRIRLTDAVLFSNGKRYDLDFSSL